MVGPRQGAAGQISRRSELRALKQQVEELDRQIAEVEALAARLDSQLAEQRRKTTDLSQRHRDGPRRRSSSTARDHRQPRTASADQRQLEDTCKEQETVTRGHDEAQQSLETCRVELREAEADIAETENQMAAYGEQIDRLEADRAVRSRDTTEIKVSLAKSEERLRNLRGRMQQFLESKEERRRRLKRTGSNCTSVSSVFPPPGAKSSKPSRKWPNSTCAKRSSSGKRSPWSSVARPCSRIVPC